MSESEAGEGVIPKSSIHDEASRKLYAFGVPCAVNDMTLGLVGPKSCPDRRRRSVLRHQPALPVAEPTLIPYRQPPGKVVKKLTALSCAYGIMPS